MNSSNRNKRRYAPQHAAADVSRQWTRYEGATRGLAQKNSGQEKPNRTKDAGQVDGGGGGVGDVALPSSVVGCRHLLANLKTSGTCTMLQGTVPPSPSLFSRQNPNRIQLRRRGFFFLQKSKPSSAPVTRKPAGALRHNGFFAAHRKQRCPFTNTAPLSAS